MSNLQEVQFSMATWAWYGTDMMPSKCICFTSMQIHRMTKCASCLTHTHISDAAMIGTSELIILIDTSQPKITLKDIKWDYCQYKIGLLP